MKTMAAATGMKTMAAATGMKTMAAASGMKTMAAASAKTEAPVKTAEVMKQNAEENLSILGHELAMYEAEYNDLQELKKEGGNSQAQKAEYARFEEWLKASAKQICERTKDAGTWRFCSIVEGYGKGTDAYLRYKRHRHEQNMENLHPNNQVQQEME